MRSSITLRRTVLATAFMVHGTCCRTAGPAQCVQLTKDIQIYAIFDGVQPPKHTVQGVLMIDSANETDDCPTP